MSPPTAHPKRAIDDQDWKVLRDIMMGDQLREMGRLRQQVELLTEQNQLMIERIRAGFTQHTQNQAQQFQQIIGPSTLEWLSQLNTAGVEERRHASEAAKTLLVGSLEQASKTSPGNLARILTPVLGPTIRSYVKAIFQQLITQMDAMMRKANFLQRLWWRIQAAKKGMSYAEFVVLQTANFSVIHAQLLRRDTSEMLVEAGTDVPSGEEADVFVAQSALASAIGNQLHPDWETVRISGQSLALQLRTLGACPPHIRVKAEQVLREAEAILGSDPLAGPMSEQKQMPLSNQLRALLEKTNTPKSPMQGIIVFGLILAGIACWAGWSIYQRSQEEALLRKISSTPGYVVQHSDYQKGKLRIRGMRDPQAPAPELLLADAGISPSRVQFDFIGFRSMETPFEEARVAQVRHQDAAREATQLRQQESLVGQLSDMETQRKALVEAVFRESVPLVRYPLNFEWKDNALVISGQCPEEQLPVLEKTAENLKGVTKIELKVVPQSAPPWSNVRRLEGLDIPFVSGTAQLESEASTALETAVHHILQADEAVVKMGGKPPNLRLRAWPITGIWQEGNRAIQLERLNLVQAALVKAGVKAQRIQPGVLDPAVIHSRQGVWVEWMSEAAR